MSNQYIGQRIRRNEDPRLLTGQALFVDDVQMPGMLHAAFLRSDYAHARLRSIDVSAARAHSGVVAVYTAEDMGDFWRPGPLLVPAPHSIPGLIFNKRTQIPLVRDKARHVGEPLAVVIADSRYTAEDALADILLLSLIHISEPTRLLSISYAVFCLKKKTPLIRTVYT